jgi:hypothetical protein
LPRRRISSWLKKSDGKLEKGAQLEGDCTIDISQLEEFGEGDGAVVRVASDELLQDVLDQNEREFEEEHLAFSDYCLSI